MDSDIKTRTHYREVVGKKASKERQTNKEASKHASKNNRTKKQARKQTNTRTSKIKNNTHKKQTDNKKG